MIVSHASAKPSEGKLTVKLVTLAGGAKKSGNGREGDLVGTLHWRRRRVTLVRMRVVCLVGRRGVVAMTIRRRARRRVSGVVVNVVSGKMLLADDLHDFLGCGRKDAGGAAAMDLGEQVEYQCSAVGQLCGAQQVPRRKRA